METATYPLGTIAKLLMLSERRVRQLSAEGVVCKASRGRYELVPTIQGYIKFLRGRVLDLDSPDGETSHKTRLLKARADLAEYEAQRLAGKLVPVEEVEKTWCEIVSRFRQRTLAVAPKAAPLAAVESTAEG